ncbi:MAG: universal stress protein [Nitrospirae bacterium]|nr:universal stress protein [Nitrospirota bacterium]
MKIMICYDGSEGSHRAMEQTVDYFKAHKPEIILVTVVDPPLDSSLENEEVFERWRNSRQNELLDAAKWVTEHGLEADAILAVGDPRKMLIKAIEKKAPDLVVVGKRGRTEMDKMILGSVSAFLVRHSPLPVLVMT